MLRGYINIWLSLKTDSIFKEQNKSLPSGGQNGIF